MHNVFFTIGLSNGETLTEEKGNYVTIPGELSPFQKAKAYIQKTGATITSVSLYSRDGKRWNIPSSGKNPKFSAFAECPKPISYQFFRKMGADVNPEDGSLSNEEVYSVIEATYEDGRILQTWVHNTTFASWTLII